MKNIKKNKNKYINKNFIVLRIKKNTFIKTLKRLYNNKINNQINNNNNYLLKTKINK